MAFTPKGMIQYNAMKQCYEIWDGTAWVPSNIPANQYISHNTVPIPSAGHLTINNTPTQNKFRVTTKSGEIVVDLETGDLTMPVGMNRKDGLREFWLAFQDNFKGGNEKVKELEYELSYAKAQLTGKQTEMKKQIKERLRDKVMKNYGSQKFIMMKPDDLIKFLEIDT